MYLTAFDLFYFDIISMLDLIRYSVREIALNLYHCGFIYYSFVHIPTSTSNKYKSYIYKNILQGWNIKNIEFLFIWNENTFKSFKKKKQFNCATFCVRRVSSH